MDIFYLFKSHYKFFSIIVSNHKLHNFLQLGYIFYFEPQNIFSVIV